MRVFSLFVLLLCTSNTFAQAPDAQALAVQKEKLALLKRLDGNWRGKAEIVTPKGKLELTQTERVGPMLDGVVKMVEGSGYDAQGEKQFNALGIIVFDNEKKQYQMRSYAQGRMGDFTLTITDTGFTWEIPAGPAKIQYNATITDTTWREVGQRVVDGQEPMTFFEMNLTKIGETEWPAGNPVPTEQ